MNILEVIEFLIKKGGTTSANELNDNYKAALKSNDFSDMAEVLDHAQELHSLYS